MDKIKDNIPSNYSKSRSTFNKFENEFKIQMDINSSKVSTLSDNIKELNSSSNVMDLKQNIESIAKTATSNLELISNKIEENDIKKDEVKANFSKLRTELNLQMLEIRNIMIELLKK